MARGIRPSHSPQGPSRQNHYVPEWHQAGFGVNGDDNWLLNLSPSGRRPDGSPIIFVPRQRPHAILAHSAAAAGYLTSLDLRSLNRRVIVLTATRNGRTPLSYRLPCDGLSSNKSGRYFGKC